MTIADVDGDGYPDLICDPMLINNGDGTFRPGPALPDLGNTLGGAIAFDVNGDGKADLVFPAYEHNRLSLGVALADGSGSFQSPFLSLSSVNDEARDSFGAPVVEGDFNGDGIPDVAVLGSQEIVVFFGMGGGQFLAGPQIVLPYISGVEFSTTLAAADMNGDGRLDLIVNTSQTILTLFSKGDGTFQLVARSPLGLAGRFQAGYGAFAVGDLNGDGIPDAATLTANTSTLKLFLGQATGKFHLWKTLSVPSEGPAQSLVIADLNGDGIPDIANGLVSILFGFSHGEFSEPVYYAVDGTGLSSGGSNLAVADLRKSGRLDIVASVGGSVSILLNTGKGKFEDGVQTTVAGATVACSATGDFNGDGNPDLAISNGSAIEIYLGTGKASAPFTAGATYSLTSPYCPVAGDLNSDGKLDLLVGSGAFVSVIAFLGNGDGTFQEGPSSPVPNLGFFALGDFNGDGKLDYAASSNWMAYGNGDGSFGTPFSFATSVPFNGFQNVAAQDLNGDGLSDVVLTSYLNPETAILLNRGGGQFAEIVQPNACPPKFRGVRRLER